MTINIPRFGALLALLLAAALAAGLLVLVGTEPAEAAFPGANGKIAFTSNRTSGPGVDNPTGDNEIFAMKPDGTALEQLTFNTADDYHPAWSADGSWITYTSEQDGNAEIYKRSYGVGDIDQTLRLTKNTAHDDNPVFSRDGSKIAFRSFRDGGNSEIYVMDADDRNGDENGDNQTNLTQDTVAFDDEPAWSPDGSKIAFTSVRDGNNNVEVYVMDADGTDPVPFTNNSAEDYTPNWSPDGSKIAFTSLRDGNSNVYVMNADGSEQKRLTKKAGDDYEPAWSPGGKKIAFTSFRDGNNFEIYVMKAKPEGKKNRPKNLTKTDVGVANFWPDWQPRP